MGFMHTMNNTAALQVAPASRDGFSSRFGVLAATLGSAVGLGNIWKVPYLTGANGGAGFLLIYLLATLAIGLPIMIAEITLGRRAQSNPLTAFRRVAPGSGPWWLTGLLGIAASFLIIAFYSEVGGWVFAYVLQALRGTLTSTDPAVTQAAFERLTRDPAQSLFWQWAVLLLIGAILMAGVTKGIEAVTKRLMPLLLILLIGLCAVSLTLDRAREGLHFLFAPDFHRITVGTVLVAMGLAFFKLSIGMGTMITYGSYYRADQNIPATALRVMLADLTISLLAGIAIFPAVFTFGFAPASGPSLVFITLPAVFAQIPQGQWLMSVFFILTAFAATGALLSLLEVPILTFQELLHLKRRQATLLTLMLLVLPSAGAALSLSTLSSWRVAGLNLFDLFDYVSSNILMPLGGVLLALFTGWVWGAERLGNALSNQGRLSNGGLARAISGLLKYVTPILVLAVMASGLGLLSFLGA